MAWNTIPSWRNQAGAAKTKRTGKVLNDDRADWREAWALFPGDVAYVWHGALHAATVAESLVAAASPSARRSSGPRSGWCSAAATITGSTNPAGTRSRKTGKGHWAGDRKQTTLWHIASRDQDAETVHGTQKPVECMRRPILNNSSPGQAVYEPFCGFRHHADRRRDHRPASASAIELNPAYVDVAVERWQAFTGEDAMLDGDGRSFAEYRRRAGRAMSAAAASADRDPPGQRQPRQARLEPRRAGSARRQSALPDASARRQRRRNGAGSPARCTTWGC